MNKFKKLAGPVSSLGTVTLVLVVALVALFISNNGFGWFTFSDNARGTGMRVDVASPNSPVESYRFMTVHSTAFAEQDGQIYHRYGFTPLGKETAHMVMNNYSKLEAPTYHILLHLVLKEEVTKDAGTNILMHTFIDGDTYTLNVADLPALADEFSPTPVGMSAALEFFVLTQGVDSLDTFITEEKTEGEETVTVETALRWYDDAPGNRTNGHSFEMDTVSVNGTVTQLVFSGMEEVEIPVSKGQREIFIFITYDPERINLLQDYASPPSASGSDMGNKNFKFKSDFYIFFEDEKAKT